MNIAEKLIKLKHEWMYRRKAAAADNPLQSGKVPDSGEEIMQRGGQSTPQTGEVELILTIRKKTKSGEAYEQDSDSGM